MCLGHRWRLAGDKRLFELLKTLVRHDALTKRAERHIRLNYFYFFHPEKRSLYKYYIYIYICNIIILYTLVMQYRYILHFIIIGHTRGSRFHRDTILYYTLVYSYVYNIIQVYIVIIINIIIVRHTIRMGVHVRVNRKILCIIYFSILRQIYRIYLPIL